MFLRNYWYAAGFPEELGREFLARTFLNENVVMFRKEDGTPVALEDRCAHRRVPLSLGRLIGDTLECGYHGLQYDCLGKCTRIPGQERIPPKVAVRAYPMAEKHHFLWIWMGDTEKADEYLIPDYSILDRPGLRVSNIQFHMDAHVQLIIDNLLDLSHLTYVHGTTTGSPEISEVADVKTVRKGDAVQVLRWMENVPPAPAFQEFGGYTSNIDSWQVCEFRPPTYVRVSYGSAPAGRGIPDGDWYEDQGDWGFYVYHGLTPETEKRAHHYRYVAFKSGMGDAETIEEFRFQCDQIITEDSVLFPRQQVWIDRDPAETTVWDINSRVEIVHDGGLTAARQIVDSLLTKQQNGNRVNGRKSTKKGKRKSKKPARARAAAS